MGPILAHLVEMAHGLGLGVVLEGVEREEEVALARHLGCDLAQGFLLHRPSPEPVCP
ncbi:hypothetical protein TCCBUS3UF1_1670 [Thermus sp. CCB_US3_UF1]|uniref:EAL domain-containing protein n=1 Tax=unclassified Thermus TaxID=2619321 RepID=UPI0002389676|nr:EAL domain-containing protein [Thermus sp. CCB_US3_UF1]AEV15216.1 hypothetical protein TCCBUS3UF1_1670 [Thermus sp. CCB_US3_UF1]